MGIKGVYAQLGQAKRISLSKIAADSYRDSDRPLRLAIDFAIWQYQTQAAQGGHNPAIRTLYYRLLRLKATAIQPIFVFDGPKKPSFKRNKRSGRGCSVASAQAKRLIRLLGFAYHDAPGEAEAECALLQKHGIVDAVLSEDVDTIMFGCTRTLRNWSGESKTSKVPTHVTEYDVHDMKLASLGLDREGMVLVALMSGGDYLPDGIPGCGVKVACEAAKAGYGKSICQLKASDTDAIQTWRESLIHELRTNESKFFRTKHKALLIPEDFPNLEVLRYYTHPVVSPVSTLDTVKEKLAQPSQVYLDELREFTREEFGWDFRIGAHKFMRGIGNALLLHKLRHEQPVSQELVTKITGRRTHFSADAEPELRLAYIPSQVVPIDLSNEADEVISSSREGLALNSDDELETPTEEPLSAQAAALRIYDPEKPELAWVLEEVARKIAPRAVAKWEEGEQVKASRKSPKKKSTKRAENGGMTQGALDKFVRVTKTTAKPAILKHVTPDLDSEPVPEPRLASFKSSPSVRDLRQPLPPLPGPSKQPKKNSTDRSADDFWTSFGSQTTPTRKPKFKKVPEEIFISSSPVAAELSTLSSPATNARKGPAGSQKVSDAVRPTSSQDQVSPEVRTTKLSKPSRKPAQSHLPSKQLPTSKLKQSSMAMFTTKAKPSSQTRPIASPPRSSVIQHDPFDDSEDSDGDLPPISSFTSRATVSKKAEPGSSPTSPSKRAKSPAWTEVEESSQTEPSKKTKERKKKKFYVPRTSAVGFFKEVEADEYEPEKEERRQASRQQNSSSRRAIRMSDVSVIDLTQDDD